MDPQPAGISREELQLAARNHGMPLEALRHEITPVGLHYLLVHYDIPAVGAEWRLRVDGRVRRPLELDLDDLRARPSVTQPVTMECAGNGRAAMEPHVTSQPWLLEAVGTGEWTGAPLAALLEQAGLLDDAVEIVFEGLDRGLEGGDRADLRAQPHHRAGGRGRRDPGLRAERCPAAVAARLPAAAGGAGLVRHDQREVAVIGSRPSASRSRATSRRSPTAGAGSSTSRAGRSPA